MQTHAVNFSISLCVYERLLFDDILLLKEAIYFCNRLTAKFSQEHIWIKLLSSVVYRYEHVVGV